MVDKEKILAGRKVVDAYRTAHTKLHSKPWHRGVPEKHTPLLKALVNALEGLGFTSAETEFEPKKTEILAKFWAESDELNVQELGFASREGFEAEISRLNIDAEPEAQALREALRVKWR